MLIRSRFSGLFRFCLLASLLALPVRAELLVLNTGGSGSPLAGGQPVIFRFDPLTGTPRGLLGYPAEAYTGMTLAAPGEICFTANTLGYFTLFSVSAGSQAFVPVSSGDQARWGAALRLPDGRLLSTRWDDPAGAVDIVLHGPEGPAIFIASGTGGLRDPQAMVLGPDGLLYVADAALGILRFDVATGAFVDVFVPQGKGGLGAAFRLAFGADGRLYVTDGTAAVFRFDGATGDYVDTFVQDTSGRLGRAAGLAFGPDGHLYVVSRAAGEVLRYDGGSGAYLGVAASDPGLRSPLDLAFTAEQPARPAPAYRPAFADVQR